MIVEPEFFEHWKTRKLQRSLGAEAILALQRLWCYCQLRKDWVFDMDPEKLAAITNWPGDEGPLWSAMTDPKSGWLTELESGEWEVRAWEEINRGLIAKWKTGQKGGRPKKPKGNPSETRQKPVDNLSITSEEPVDNLPGTCPEPIRLDRIRLDREDRSTPKPPGERDLDAERERVNRMFALPASEQWSYSDLQALQDLGARDEGFWRTMEQWFHVSPNEDDRDDPVRFRRKGPGTFLADPITEYSKAKDFAKSYPARWAAAGQAAGAREKKRGGAQAPPPAPEGWHAVARELYPAVDEGVEWFYYPEDCKRAIREELENRKKKGGETGE